MTEKVKLKEKIKIMKQETQRKTHRKFRQVFIVTVGISLLLNK